MLYFATTTASFETPYNSTRVTRRI